MGMLFIIHLNLSPFFFFFFLGSFCFLHFRHRTWMYDTIRVYQGFTIFNHYILSVGLCSCVRDILLQNVCVQACVRVSVCMCVRLPVRMSVFASECVYVYVCACVWDQDCRYSTFYFVLFSLPLSCFVPLTVFILSSLFKTWSFLLPSLWYLLWYSFLHKPSAFFLFWTSAIQKKMSYSRLWK